MRTDAKVLGLRLKEGILDDLGCFASSTMGGGCGFLSGSLGLGLVIETRTLANGALDNQKEVVSHCELTRSSAHRPRGW